LDVLTHERIVNAYHRLLESFGAPGEKDGPDGDLPLGRPTEAELMNRAIEDANRNPLVGTTELRAALELAGLDQRLAETREMNIVTLLRARHVSWREIAHHRGLQSSQAAKQRYDRLARQPEVVVYAFRAAEKAGAPWHGDPDALPDGQYETGTIDFNPPSPRPFSGLTLEVRYGAVAAEIMPPYLRAYARVNGRQVAVTSAVQQELFGG
jgi:hypothetical protein